LDSIRTALVNGTYSFGEAVARYGDEPGKIHRRTGFEPQRQHLPHDLDLDKDMVSS